MKILLVKDKNVDINFKESVSLLNNICSNISFSFLDYDISYKNEDESILYDEEIFTILEKLEKYDKSHVLYITNRNYDNNFFYYFNQYIMLLSFSGWEYYTNLSIENGLFYFISTMIALTFNINNRHMENTGCLYDFLGDKTGVDEGMRKGQICDECIERIKILYETSPINRNRYYDLKKILNILSNASKWNKNVLSEEKIESEYKVDWSSFEDQVADIYRKLGAKVKQNINLSGFQIDVLIEEETASKQIVRSIIECKYYKNKVGIGIVLEFYNKFNAIKIGNNIDKAIIVTYSGFSQEAQLFADSNGIELLQIKDLTATKEMIQSQSRKKITELRVVQKKTAEITRYPDIFTIMPFSKEFEDTYYFGIHETVKECGLTCERVDEMEFVGDISDKIHDSIKYSKIIIAELTLPNPNVYYEFGYANAIGKTIIPITKNVSDAPFDVRQFNHITYDNIKELREKLGKRIQALLS